VVDARWPLSRNGRAAWRRVPGVAGVAHCVAGAHRADCQSSDREARAALALLHLTGEQSSGAAAAACRVLLAHGALVSAQSTAGVPWEEPVTHCD